jgi:hypothetical protein
LACIGTVSGQKFESTPYFTAKLRLLTRPLTFLLVKQSPKFLKTETTKN